MLIIANAAAMGIAPSVVLDCMLGDYAAALAGYNRAHAVSADAPAAPSDEEFDRAVLDLYARELG